MAYFNVSIANTFEAEDIHDAVQQMADWLVENSNHVGYRAEDIENDRIYLVDGVDGGVYQIEGSPDGEER